MSALFNRTIVKNVLRTPPLRNILFVYLGITILLSVYVAVFEIPLFRKAAQKNAEEDSRMITTYLAGIISPDSNQLFGDALSDDAILKIEKAFSAFRFEQINLFSKSGKVVYSTNPKYIGKINRKGYFQKIVAKGNIYSKVVEKEAKSSQGRIVTSDVVETYVPLMHDGAFQGAFEIYNDVTDEIEMHHRLLLHFLYTFSVLAFIILIAVVMFLFHASKIGLESRQQEAMLRESEERHRMLVESSSDAILSLDLERNIVSCNRAFLELFGYDQSEVTGKSIRMIHPSEENYRLFGDAAYSEIERLDSFRTEWDFLRKDGTLCPAETTTSVIKSPDGSIAGYVAIIRDMTDRREFEEALKKSEEKYRSILENMEEGYYEVDLAGNFTFLNEAMSKIRGQSRDELMWTNNRDYMDEETAKKVYQMYNRIYTTGISAKNLEWETLRSDGTRSHLEVSASLMRDSKGQPIGFRGVVRDVTERKRFEEEKAKLEARLQQAHKMEAIGILAGGVAHDLNNILSGIVSYPELILMDLPEKSPLRKPISTIQKSGEKAAVIVQDLLTLARRGVAITEVVNLNHLISEQLKSPEFEKLISFYPNIKVGTGLEKDLLNIKGSTAHLSKSIMNLISNAAEAMIDGGTIFISTENRYIDQPIRGYDHVEEGDYVIVTVSDTGIGISSEDMERIFEPFYTKKVMGRSGTGLGMAVVWGTVKDHNGYIDLKSTIGKGTTFTLYFPATRETSAKDTAPLPMDDYLGKGETILVIDDVAEQREIASGMLKKLGYSVAAVSSGEEAVEYLKERSVDLIVLDMIMPKGINGRETYERIIKIHPGQKAIIASGFSETADVKKAQKIGAGKYIKKPYTLEKIGLALKEELEK